MRPAEEMLTKPANAPPLVRQDPVTACLVGEADRVNRPVRVGRGHLTLTDFAKGDPAHPPLTVRPRRAWVGLYDLAVALLLVLSLAAALACLARMG